MNKTLNLFYEEPEPDRWLAYDRYPRRIIRRIFRGSPRPGGQMRVFLNLCTGLDRLGVKYRINNFRHALRNPDELACLIGKPQLLDKISWRNPILFGAAVYSHPSVDPHLLDRLPIRKVIVPGQWMRKMCEPYWGSKVVAWPVGIDTDIWKPIKVQKAGDGKSVDFLIYDKVRWEHGRYECELIAPIRDALNSRGLSFKEIRYGYYREDEFRELLQQCRAMVFLCEHETQGIAYQQALSCNVPILAWDRGGYWQDPEFYPHRVKFESVSSVPYWDERCGMKFAAIAEFCKQLDRFSERQRVGELQPRDFVLENLTLETCAQQYVDIANSVEF